MHASDLATLALAACFGCACAEAYDAVPAGAFESSVIAPTSGGAGGSLAVTGGSPADALTGGFGGATAPLGEPCLRNDVQPCPCEGTDVQGQRVCMFDMASPTQGFFSACQGCPPPMAELPPDAGAPCADPTCMMPTAGAAGMSGTGGMSGAEAGAGGGDGDGDSPMEPVEDCDGVPEGTECDRECIFPGNTARCNGQGDCSCL